MVPEEDLLFCKIAVAHRLVTSVQAQKCLAICNKREEEGKRRPLVGALFTKYNLLKAPEVQRIYDAVNRRLGKSGGTGNTSILLAPAKERLAKAARSGVRGKPLSSTSSILKRRQRLGAQRVNRKQLTMGILFGLVFLGVVAGILIVFISGRESPQSSTESAGSVTDKGGVGNDVASSSLGSSLPEASASEAAPPAEAIKMDPTYAQEVRLILSDCQRCLIDNNPEQGKQLLSRFEERRGGRYISPEMLAELEAMKKSLAGGGDEGEEGDSESGDTLPDDGLDLSDDVEG